MAALLTSILDNSQKVAEYIAECRELGIKLLPPDVNESDSNFTVSGENIRFGLVAIKGIGWGAIDELVADRKANGPFRDFMDFCQRMSGKELNRRAVENLIKSGAFDSMGYKRRALLQICGAVLDSVSRSMKDNIDGQMNLFGEAEALGNAHVSIPIPDVEEYSPMELMAMEKETTGLYLSGHPMDSYRDTVRRIGAVPIGSIMSDFASDGGPRRFADNQTVTVAGVVATAKTRTTKNNTLMSYVQLEDDTGSMELMAFQRALDQGGAFLKENSVIVVRGRISARDDKEPQLMVDNIMPIEDATQAYQPPRETKPAINPEQKLWVKLKSQDDPELKRIQLILTMFPGDQQMIIYCEAEKKRIGARCLIHPALVAELEERLGKENVVVK
jgi:DNA polymerase-3 subunit alpha